MTPSVFEGKFELDSLCAVLKLSHQYWELTQDASAFLGSSPYLDAVEKVINIIVQQQNSTAEDGDHPAYNFSRPPPEDDVYPNPLSPARRCGLSKCGFRPSDDETKLPFLVPANAMAAVELANTATVLQALKDPSGRAPALATRAQSLAKELRAAVAAAGIHDGLYAYEVNGFGQYYSIDDANVPSLLSLPYLGFVNNDDPSYAATRARLLSHQNPYFFAGSEGSGIGSPHTPYEFIWPMAVSLQALTSSDDAEIEACLVTLKNSARETGLMHESFNKNNASDFTRPWFAWANSLFGELIIKLASERPYLIFSN
jgi:meiotically up-regulated gene 157 (Mug157) protein